MARGVEEFVAEVRDINDKAKAALSTTPQQQQGAAALMLLHRLTSMMLESWEEQKSATRQPD